MEIRVLRSLTRMFYFLPRHVAARDDSRTAEDVGLLTRGGEGARARGEVGATAVVHAATTAGGEGGSTGPQIM
jgi:hypothetical protein